jgi:hypothetical protein
MGRPLASPRTRFPQDGGAASSPTPLAAAGLRVRRAGAEVRSLESVFVELVHDAARRDEGAPRSAGGGA